MAAEVDHLEAEKNAYRTKRDELDKDLTLVIQHRDELAADKNALREENKALIEARDALVRKASDLNSRNEELRKECDMLVVRCQVLQNEINALVRKMGGKQEEKTDRPSVCDKELMQEVGKLIAQAKYQEGRADALAAIVERCSFGGGCCHE